MVFKKQKNENGSYVDKNGVHYDVLSCERTESLAFSPTQETDSEGQVVYELRVVVNQGWDEHPDAESAARAYGLVKI